MVSLPSERPTRFGNPAWPGGRTANFAAFGAWSETLLKNAESLRDSDALMRVAVPRRRGPAGLRDLFRFCRNSDLYAMRACARRGVSLAGEPPTTEHPAILTHKSKRQQNKKADCTEPRVLRLPW